MVWLTILVIGVMVSAVASSGPSVIQGYCDGDPLRSTLDPLIDQIYVIDHAVIDYPTKYMCSAYCPCWTPYISKWLNMTEPELNRFNRTNSTFGRRPVDPRTGYMKLSHTPGHEIKAYFMFTDCDKHLREMEADEATARGLTDLLGPEHDTAIKLVSYFE